MKAYTFKPFYLSLAIIFFFTGCTKEPGIPDSLSEILERNEQGSSGGGGGNGAGGGAPSRYRGAGAATVNQLLSAVPGWRTPSCATCNDGILPQTAINTNCMRDIYVSAAVDLAWAVESYYRLGDIAKAEEMKEKMFESLQNARNLCGGAPVFGGGSCLTLSIFPC